MSNGLNENQNKRTIYRFLKRSFDIVMSFLALSLFLPFAIIISIGTAISTKANPFYPDKRLGRHGKTIYVLKFRTMYKDAETNPEKYLSEEQMEEFRHERKIENDPRVTPFGFYLRKTSLDEFPQFVNVFTGDMSLVGPRPITRKEIRENFDASERGKLLAIRPGITGNWQVFGRKDDTWNSGKRKQLVMEYLVKRSVAYDLKLLFLTIPSCLGYAVDVDKKARKARANLAKKD